MFRIMFVTHIVIFCLGADFLTIDITVQHKKKESAEKYENRNQRYSHIFPVHFTFTNAISIRELLIYSANLSHVSEEKVPVGPRKCNSRVDDDGWPGFGHRNVDTYSTQRRLLARSFPAFQFHSTYHGTFAA